MLNPGKTWLYVAESSCRGYSPIFRNGEPEPELLGCVHPHGSHLDWRLT